MATSAGPTLFVDGVRNRMRDRATGPRITMQTYECFVNSCLRTKETDNVESYPCSKVGSRHRAL